MTQRSATPSRIYAALAVVGAIVPFPFLLPWMQRPDASLATFFAGPFVNGPAAVFAADVLWAASVFVVFAIIEGRRAGVRPIWLAPLMIFVVGLCFALPLFLWLRERALMRSIA